jgi:UDP-N-acetylmuramoyl-tripeptide--D-alanyl-D-alanine ligase
MDPVRLSQLVAATRGSAPALTSGHRDFDRIELDSREVQPGDVFWAMRGERQDGHNFVGEAFERGAAACVVEHIHGIEAHNALIQVDDTRNALRDFAHWYRRRQDVLVVGVTGSVGKTTTREMVHAVLGASHHGIRSRENFNNEIGLPLTLLDIDDGHEFAVLEMGARRIGDIQALAHIAEPEVGVITTIAPAHLETFGSLQGVAQGKGELFEALPAHGFAVMSGDDESLQPVARRAACRVIRVGMGRDNDVRTTGIEVSPRGLSFQVDGHWYETPAMGRHMLIPALCALAIGREVGMDADAIAAGLRNLELPPGRCRSERCGAWTVIDDTYNASPASMRAACELLRDWPGANKKLLIVGDMLELGESVADFHRELGDRAVRAKVDRLLAFGPHAGCVVSGARDAGLPTHCVAECHDLDSLLAVLDCWLAPGDVALVKGSRGMRMERVVEWFRQRSQELADEQARPTRACA